MVIPKKEKISIILRGNKFSSPTFIRFPFDRHSQSGNGWSKSIFYDIRIRFRYAYSLLKETTSDSDSYPVILGNGVTNSRSDHVRIRIPIRYEKANMCARASPSDRISTLSGSHAGLN